MIIVRKSNENYDIIKTLLSGGKRDKSAEIAKHFGDVCAASGEICRILHLDNVETIEDVANILNALALEIEKEG